MTGTMMHFRRYRKDGQMVLNDRLIAVVICGVFFLFSSIFVLGHYQNHNGDFGQYFTHAQNLLHGRSWDYLVEGYPAVLPAFPAVLAALTWLFGVNAHAYGMFNSACWALACFLAFDIYHKQFQSRITGWAFLLTLLFSPYVMAFQQDGQPNLLYTSAVITALWASMPWTERSPRTYEIFLVLLPSLVRLESLALFASIGFVLILSRRWRLLAIPAAGVLITLGTDILIHLLYDLRSNIALGLKVAETSSNTQGGERGLIELLIRLTATASGYMLLFSELILPRSLLLEKPFSFPAATGLKLVFSLSHIVPPLLAIIGVLAHKNFLKLDKVFFAAHISIISAFMLSALPTRYIFPILPIFWFYTIYSIEYMLTTTRLRPNMAGLVLLAALGPLILAGAARSAVVPNRTNTLFSAAAKEMAVKVAELQQGRSVGYIKHRLMILLMDVHGGDPRKVIQVRNIKRADRLLSDGGILVMFKKPAFQKDLLRAVESNPANVPIWQNEGFVVFSRSID